VFKGRLRLQRAELVVLSHIAQAAPRTGCQRTAPLDFPSGIAAGLEGALCAVKPRQQAPRVFQPNLMHAPAVLPFASPGLRMAADVLVGGVDPAQQQALLRQGMEQHIAGHKAVVQSGRGGRVELQTRAALEFTRSHNCLYELWALTPHFHPYPEGRLFSVARSAGLPRPPISSAWCSVLSGLSSPPICAERQSRLPGKYRLLSGFCGRLHKSTVI